jgi:glyoxylase-like metal-dependent hydrolase (beta-lactamase superfamily II)
MLKQITGRSFYFDSKVCTGAYIDGSDAAVIDAGMDEDYSRKVINAIKERGAEIRTVILTHSHGDHYGGCPLIVKRCGAKVYAPPLESAIIMNPIIEPVYLFGADPIDELKGKFFMGQPIDVTPITTDRIGELSIVKSPGHSFDMVSVATPDGVIFASDTFFPKPILDKYKIPYLFDVGKSLDTLHMLKDSPYRHFVVAHGGLLAREEAIASIDANITRIHEILEEVTMLLREKSTIEGVLRHLSEKHDLYVTNAQYFLNLSIIKAYLSYLRKTGRIDCMIDGKMLYWKSI